MPTDRDAIGRGIAAAALRSLEFERGVVSTGTSKRSNDTRPNGDLEGAVMPRNLWGFIASFCALVAGCSDPKAPTPVSRAPARGSSADGDFATDTSVATKNDVDAAVATTTDDPADEPLTPVSGAEHGELKLKGISFVVPALWKKVRPPNNIIEAEYELPPPDGGEEPGRLTLMSSGGVPQEVIATRAREFTQDSGQGPRVETVKIGDRDATWVDLRGEWKGPVFSPIEPRPDYRMLLVIIPFTEKSAFYAKLTGPSATVTAREEEFREFVRSAKVEPAIRE
jgi:hypothetical protein